MKFNASKELTLGIEIELQIVDPKTGNLAGYAHPLIESMKKEPWRKMIKPEITQSMVEINSSIHQNADNLLKELIEFKKILSEEANKLGVLLCGGGTHPFQKWKYRKIYPTQRFIRLYKQYGYLAKRFTIFGQHVHIGCSSGDNAIYLILAISRYIPHFIALTASSPIYQGVDTGFDSTRVTIANAFPLSGVMPYHPDWQAFVLYFEEMSALKIIQSIKDFYWDIRPKPDTGTVEIRICDTPLNIETSAMIAAYIQTIALYLFEKKNININESIYLPYSYNRFQASRFGFRGNFINPYTKETTSIQKDILTTIDEIFPYAKSLKNESLLQELKNRVKKKNNDANRIRQIHQKINSLRALVKYQTELWQGA